MMNFGMIAGIEQVITGVVIAAIVIFFIGIVAFISSFYRKVAQGEALIVNGMGGPKVSFSGAVVIPILHKAEYMDISVKRISVDRKGAQGLICQDNLRADIQVAFFVRVNNTVEDVKKVAQALGCERASDEKALYELFDAKFSEALKTVGKRFDFTELYTSRLEFKEEILKIIGTDLNGYVLEDVAIDYLEQTDKELMNPNNILDAEGIKKITVLTAEQFEMANSREREKDKTITQQNVEAQEAILELNRQLAEADAKQKREVATAQAREEAETKKIQAEERQKFEKARIQADEEIQVAEENRQRQVIVAAKNKERTNAIETERVEKDRGLEATERERLVSIAQMEKEKVVEDKKREVQLVIRDRVTVEKTVAEEEEKIKDTRDFAGADRRKKVTITKAEEDAESALVKDIKAAEAAKRASELLAQKQLIEADANEKAATKNADAKKTLAEAAVKEHAVSGVAEAEVLQAKAVAIEKQGAAEANVMIAKAGALEKQGNAEASVMSQKYHAEADGIRDKAEAMKIFDAVGKEHEEFKLKLNKELEVELAQIRVQKDIAEQQAIVISQALKSAQIDIVGGENTFFEKLVNSITVGKSIDRLVNHSQVVGDIRNTFLSSGDPDETMKSIRNFISRFGLKATDIRDLSVAALMMKMIDQADDAETKGLLHNLMDTAKNVGIDQMAVKNILNRGKN